jgi:hypothetical protein
MTAAEKLRQMAQTAEESVIEMERFSDGLLVKRLIERAAELWPRRPELIPDYRLWLGEARDLLARLPDHEATLTRVRQETFLRQVVEGVVEEGASEPEWEEADPRNTWRHETTRLLLKDLARLEGAVVDIKGRMRVASTIWQKSIGDYQDEWDEALFFIADSLTYDGLEMEPQIGLVPLAEDPKSGLWEFWLVESGERPERDPETDRWVITGETGIVLVLLPGATFTMGATKHPKGPNYDPQAQSDETPLNVLLSPFFLSKYELTQGQWLRVMQETPSNFGANHRLTRRDWAAHPVEQVDWHHCRQALARLGLALPTEAQWEYGARGGTDTPWWTGKEADGLAVAGNLSDLSYEAVFENTVKLQVLDWDDGYTAHAPVGSFLANPFGLHDTVGNVDEWCQDAYVAETLAGREGDPSRGG